MAMKRVLRLDENIDGVSDEQLEELMQRSTTTWECIEKWCEDLRINPKPLRQLVDQQMISVVDANDGNGVVSDTNDSVTVTAAREKAENGSAIIDTAEVRQVSEAELYGAMDRAIGKDITVGLFVGADYDQFALCLDDGRGCVFDGKEQGTNGNCSGVHSVVGRSFHRPTISSPS